MPDRRSSLFLTIHCFAGTDIAEFAEDAIDLARRTGCTIVHNFNGLRLHIDGNDVIEEVVDQYRHYAEKESAKFKKDQTR
jgi:hypothetical protein